MSKKSDIVAIALFLLADVAIVVASWYIPAEMQIARTAMASIQFVGLAITGLLTIRYVVTAF